MNNTNNQVSTDNREREIFKVTLWGSLVNFGLLVFKFIAGIVGGSAAMLADAVHSLSDFVTDVVVIVFVKLAGKPCDAGHDYGHGKYETLATALIGLMLAAVGVGILWNGLNQIAIFIQGGTLAQPGPIALAAALLSVVSKEMLYQWTARRGKVLQSQAMTANAWHHRSDALSSIGTAAGIGGAIMLGENWRVLDPLAAIVVSGLILRVAYQLIRPSMDELLDKSLPEDDERFITNIIQQQPGVSDPHNLRTRHIGSYSAIEVHFRMDGNTTLNEAHRTTREIEDKLRTRFGHKTFITTHVEPLKPDMRQPNAPAEPDLPPHSNAAT